MATAVSPVWPFGVTMRAGTPSPGISTVSRGPVARAMR